MYWHSSTGRNLFLDKYLFSSLIVVSIISTDLALATLPDSDLDPDGTTRAAATITAAILGFKVMGPFGALAGATFANHYGEIRHRLASLVVLKLLF